MRNVFAALIIVAVVVFVFFSYAGFFHKVSVGEGPAGPYTFVYKKATGSYHNSAKPMAEVYNWLKGNGIEATKGVGIYFDDPKSVNHEQLRYVAGCVIEGAAKPSGMPQEYTVKDFNADRCLVVTFPFKNKMNIMAGAVKVYPVIADYVKANGLPMNAVMEIYDTPGQRITYIMPLDPEFDAVKTFYM